MSSFHFPSTITGNWKESLLRSSSSDVNFYVSYRSQGSDSVECLVRGNKCSTGANTAVDAKTISATGRPNAAAGNGTGSRNADEPDAESADGAAGSTADESDNAARNYSRPNASAGSDDIACSVDNR